ncbi:dephospho-CoA kinase [Glaciecola petra]|uniref:dephospho-CoA kinase n=1 Tax=Glaciecola petra TaxID=3075602 RepID=UPI003D777D86
MTPEQLQHKYIVGLSGGIGSGKTSVSNLFAKFGVDIIDADVVAREVVEPGTAGLTALIEKFSKHILSKDGSLDRSKLRKIAFADEASKNALNNILHPIIREGMLQQLSASKSTYCILVAPLLFENGLQKLTDRTLVVDASEQQQLNRTLLRDGGQKETIENIIAAQIERNQRCKMADDIIDNSGNMDSLEESVTRLHKKYLEFSALKLKKSK